MEMSYLCDSILDESNKEVSLTLSVLLDINKTYIGGI